MTEAYHFRLEICDGAGSVVEQRALGRADFLRAIYATTFDGFCRGILHRYAPDPEGARIEPTFPAESNGAFTRTTGFRVDVPVEGGARHGLTFAPNYFRTRASALLAGLMKSRDWPAEEAGTFQLGAYLEEMETPIRHPSCLSLAPMTMEVPIRPGRRADLGPAESWDGASNGCLPVLVGQSLLQEAVAEARETPGQEIGGLVLGELRRDPGDGAVFLVATCLVSGTGTTEGTATSVTFTPATFARAREIIALRARDGPPEIIAGWYHSHPFRVCADCPMPMPIECIRKILLHGRVEQIEVGFHVTGLWTVTLLLLGRVRQRGKPHDDLGARSDHARIECLHWLNDEDRQNAPHELSKAEGFLGDNQHCLIKLASKFLARFHHGHVPPAHFFSFLFAHIFQRALHLLQFVD